MDLRLDRAGTKEGFTQADQSLVRVDVDPEQIRKLAKPDRLDSCDLHGVSSRALQPSGQSLLDQSTRPPRRGAWAMATPGSARQCTIGRMERWEKGGGAGLARFGRDTDDRLQNG